MTAPLLLSLPYQLERAPPPFEGNDIKYPESLVRHFLQRYTNPGDLVFDPFAGLGTTLFVAEEMGREPYGIEADPLKHEWVAGQLEHWSNLRYGDSARLSNMLLPKMDFMMTSPPFMAKNHTWNPLYNGNPRHAGYPSYLRRMEKIFAAINRVMKAGARAVVHADNLPGRTYTPLVRDLSIVIEKSFRLDGEIIVRWEDAREDYPYSHCLLFRKIA